MSTSPPATGVGATAGSGLPELGFLLGAAHRAQRRAWEARIADLGLTAPQAAVLRLVATRAGYGIRDLARFLGTDPMNAQRITESLVRSGLCEAGHDPSDARRRPIQPTAKGEDLARAVTRRATEHERGLRSALGDTTYHCLVDALRALLDEGLAHR